MRVDGNFFSLVVYFPFVFLPLLLLYHFNLVYVFIQNQCPYLTPSNVNNGVSWLNNFRFYALYFREFVALWFCICKQKLKYLNENVSNCKFCFAVFFFSLLSFEMIFKMIFFSFFHFEFWIDLLDSYMTRRGIIEISTESDAIMKTGSDLF